MVATRGRTFKRPWRRSCLSSKLKSSSAPIGRKGSWCFHAVGSSNAPLLGSTAAEGLPRIGRTSIATRWRFCGLPQSASCSENFVIPPDVFGQTLRLDRCGGDAGDASTCLLLTRLPSRRTMPGVLRSVPPILRSAAAILWSIALLCSAPAILWSIALLCSAPAILRLRLGQPNHSVILALLTVLT